MSENNSGYDVEYDVVVVGGGTAGISAAISSARAGAKTILVERLGALGGQMNVSGPPGYAYAHFFDASDEQVVGGIAAEMHKRLLDEGHALPHIRPEYRKVSGYTLSLVDPDWWGLLAYQMLSENGVTFLLHSLAVGVVKDGNAVTGVVVENTSGRHVVKGKVIVDCSGEGDLSDRAGAPSEMLPIEELQPHTVAFTADGVHWDEVLQYIKDNPDEFEWNHLLHPTKNWTRDQIIEAIKNVKDMTEISELKGFYSLVDKAIKSGEFHKYSGMGFFILPREGGVLQAHFQHSDQVPLADPRNEWDITRAEVEGRRQLVIAWKFIKKHLPGFKDAYITRICPEVRLRENRRVMGDYILTGDDVASARKFKDVIGKSSFHAGGRHITTGLTVAYGSLWPKDCGLYDIPYRCLVPQKVERLLLGGKMISTDKAAHNRFLQQTMVTGQAAGVAAAVCAKKNITPRQLENDVTELQEILVKQGAILYGTK